MNGRAGVTLVELIVVIALLGLIAAVGGIAMRRARPVVGVDAAAAIVMAARDSALRTGRAVTVTLQGSAIGDRRSATATATAFPDGRVMADATLGIDPLSGRASRATR